MKSNFNSKRKKSNKRIVNDSDNNNCSNILTIVLLFTVIFSIIYTYNNFINFYNKDRDINSLNDNDLLKYKDLIHRAQYLTQKYQNLTLNNFNYSLTNRFFRSNNFKLPDKSIGIITIKKDIVIGIAQDTDPKNLVVFCATANEIFNNNNVDVVLFINTPLSQRTREIVDKYNINIIEYNTKQTIDASYQKYHPSTIRWILLYQYFQKKSNNYQRVIMIDVRDSYFQLNPFDKIFQNINEPQFYAFQGVESITISQCGWNGGWVRDCFGTDILDSIGNNAIICSGISMGTMDTVMTYLQLMNDIVSGSNTLPETKSLHPKFPSCERNGMDQGVHNVLVHKHLIPNLKIYQQSSSLVANLQAHIAKFNENDFIVKNGNNAIVAIVHQYDRYNNLQSYLFKKYVYWLDSTDIVSIWKDEESCNDYKYEEDVDLFRSKCDYKMQGGASTAATCCKVCNEYKSNCNSFTFYSSVCYLKTCSRSESSNGFSLPGAISGYRS